jgi:hypothetical protein
MAKSKANMIPINPQMAPICGKNTNKTAEVNVPKSMNGIRLPKRLLVLSDKFPKNGCTITAITLSKAIINPTRVSFPGRNE